MNRDEALLLENLALLLSLADELRKLDITNCCVSELHYQQSDTALEALCFVRDRCNQLEDAIRSGQSKGKGRSAAHEHAGGTAFNVGQAAQAFQHRPLARQSTAFINAGFADRLAEYGEEFLTDHLARSPERSTEANDYMDSTHVSTYSQAPSSTSMGHGTSQSLYSSDIYEARPVHPISSPSFARTPSSGPRTPTATTSSSISIPLSTSALTPITPSDVDVDAVYVAFKDYQKVDPETDVSLKAGDQVKITCVMDDNSTALGANLATGAQGYFPLAYLAFKDEWDAHNVAMQNSAPSAAEVGPIPQSAQSLPVQQQAQPSLTQTTPKPAGAGLSSSTLDATGQSPGRYVAIRSLTAKDELETSLKIGDEIEVVFFADNGGQETAFGINMTTKTQGAFPAVYLRRLPDNPNAHKEGLSTLMSDSSASTSGAARSNTLPTDARSTGVPQSQVTRSASVGSNPPITAERSSRDYNAAPQQGVDGTLEGSLPPRHESLGEAGSPASTPPANNPQQSRLNLGTNVRDADRDSMMAAIAVLEEENAATYQLYTDTIGRLRADGRPVPLSMNLDLMKQLTNNLAHINWAPEDAEARLRETAEIVEPRVSNGRLLEHPPAPLRTASYEATREILESKSQQRVSIFRRQCSLRQRTGSIVSGGAHPDATSTKTAEQRRTTALSIVRELAQTESNYSMKLHALIDHIMTPMIQESVVPKKDSEDIFKNIPQLTSISDILAMELSDAVRNFDRDPFAVGSVFLHHAEEWNIYIKYVQNYAMAKRAIRRLENSAMFREFLDKCRRKPECLRMDLHAFLMLPIQRISQYWLLLQRLKKYSDSQYPACETIEVAQQYMLQLGSMLDYARRKDEDMYRMFEIAGEVKDFPTGLVSFTQRRYVGEYEVDDIASSKKLTAYLFSDCLLLCTPRKPREIAADGRKCQFRMKVDLKDCVVEDKHDDPAILKIVLTGDQSAATTATSSGRRASLEHRVSISSNGSTDSTSTTSKTLTSRPSGIWSRLSSDNLFLGENNMLVLRFVDSKQRDKFLADLQKAEDYRARQSGRGGKDRVDLRRESSGRRQSTGSLGAAVFAMGSGEELLDELYMQGKVG